MANVLFLTGANVPFFEQMCQNSWGKCVIFRANVPFLTGANVLRALKRIAPRGESVGVLPMWARVSSSVAGTVHCCIL